MHFLSNAERNIFAARRRTFSFSIVCGIFIYAATLVKSASTGRTESTAEKSIDVNGSPHLILVLGDDVGYNNVGFHGSNPEIQTPVLDQLATEGVTFSRFYAYSWCGPSRASLLSGRFPHRIYQNTQLATQPDQGLPLEFGTIATRLNQVGYDCYQAGKW